MLQKARSLIRSVVRRDDLADVFTDIYRNNAWEDPESVSGRGSTLARTNVIRDSLPSLLRQLGVNSLLDAACGDVNWIQHVDLDRINYTGIDIVPDLIARNNESYGNERRRFVVADITRDELPRADAILCRDCLIHLSLERIAAAIENFRASGATYLLATTHRDVGPNTEIANGEWRSVNLRLPPFSFPPPIREVVEDDELGKCLAVWRLDQLA